MKIVPVRFDIQDGFLKSIRESSIVNSEPLILGNVNEPYIRQ